MGFHSLSFVNQDTWKVPSQEKTDLPDNLVVQPESRDKSLVGNKLCVVENKNSS